jgi:hypothetical protein
VPPRPETASETRCGSPASARLTVPAGARIVAVDGAVGAASLLRRALCTTREGSTRLTLEVAGEEERVFEVVRRCDRRPISDTEPA